MTDQETNEISRLLARLVDGWPDQAAKLTRGQMGLYIEALMRVTDGESPKRVYDLRDIAAAVEDFLFGRVKGQDPAFLPKVAQLCRQVEARAIARHAAAPKPRLAYDQPPEIPAEQRKAMADRLRAAVQIVPGERA